MVSGKTIQALGKNQPHPLWRACAPMLGCWALPASPLPSGKDGALHSLLAVCNPYCSPGGAGQDTATRMDLAACGPVWWYSDCPVCHSFYPQGSQVVPAMQGISADLVGVWRI